MEELSKLTVSNLRDLCKKNGIKSSGIKSELITRLSEVKESKKEETSNVKKIPYEKKSIMEKIKNNNNPIVLTKNAFGNYENKDTCLVFNQDKLVIGKQQPDGSVLKLTKDDIEICNKYNFKYILPNNLNNTLFNGVEDLEEENDCDDEKVIDEDADFEIEEDVEEDEDIEDIDDDEL